MRYTVLSGVSSMQPVELKPAELAAVRNAPVSGLYCVVFGGVQLQESVLKTWLEACVKQVSNDNTRERPLAPCTKSHRQIEQSVKICFLYYSETEKERTQNNQVVNSSRT